jgi:hypothetical protein
MSDIQPLAYLLSSSKISLESYELLRLNRASNLRKEMLQLLDRWVDAETEARLAREILEWKRIERRKEDPDNFSTAEPLLTALTAVPIGRVDARFLCAGPDGKTIPELEKIAMPQKIGLVFCMNRARPKLSQRTRPAATASLALRLLEQPSKSARDDGQVCDDRAIGPVAL